MKTFDYRFILTLFLLLGMATGACAEDNKPKMFDFARYANKDSIVANWNIILAERGNRGESEIYSDDCSQTLGTYRTSIELKNFKCKGNKDGHVVDQYFNLVLGGLPSYSNLLKGRGYIDGGIIKTLGDNSQTRALGYKVDDDPVQWDIRYTVHVYDHYRMARSLRHYGRLFEYWNDSICSLSIEQLKSYYSGDDYEFQIEKHDDRTMIIVKNSISPSGKVNSWLGGNIIYCIFHPKMLFGKIWGVWFNIRSELRYENRTFVNIDVMREKSPQTVKKYEEALGEIMNTFIPELRTLTYTIEPEEPIFYVKAFEDIYKNQKEEPLDTLSNIETERTEDHAAKEDSGSDSYVIPVVIGGVLLGGAEWLRRLLKKRKKKNDNGNDNQNDKENEEEEDEIPDVLEMEIHKDFGDTLVAGDVPQRISACIVRHPKNGAEYVDRKLTPQIEIFADDGYMAVHVEIGTMNGWKTALIQAPAWEAPPEEGVVQFRIASPEASYTNRIHFKIQKGGIVFGQDNLTLPARYQKEVRLPILIKGMDMDTTQVKVQVIGKEREDSMDYYPEMKWDEATGLWNVSLLDVWQNEEENAEHLPGDFLTYYIDVEATSDTGFVQKGRLPLYRFYMGLAFQLDGNDVGCYLEEYDPAHHIDSKRVVKMDGKEYTPAETRCALRYFGYDEKSHKLIVMNPVVSAKPEDFQVKALVEGQQQMIDNLGLQLVIRSFSNGAPSYRLRCSKGVLNAPNRLYAMIEAKSHIGDVELTFKRVVVLQSQAKPSFKSPNELVEWQKENNTIRKKLEGIDRDIYAAGLGDRLAPLVQYIRLQIEAYNRDGHYGFDRRNVKKIYQTYNSIMTGERGAAYEHPLVACDNLEEVVWEYFKSMRTTINDMGTFQKIFASVATLGLFDVAVGVVEVVGEMKDYVDKGGDSTFGMFYVGVKYVTKKYLIEKAMAVAASGVKNYWKSRGDFKTAWQQTKLDVKDLVTKEINSVKEFGKKFSAAEEAKARNAQANQKADELVKEAKKMPPKPDADFTDEAVKFGRKRAQKNLKELQDAIDRAKAHPTEANVIKRNEMILQCQKDKQTMMMLKGQKNLETIEAANMGVNFGECRKELNNFFDKAYKATDNRMAYRLSEKVPGLKPSDVKIMNATSSAKDKLLSGKGVTFDRDVTYYYVDKATGKVKYFSQELTEKMYSQEFYEVTKASATLGYVPVKQATSTVKGFAKQMDQTIVEDVLGHSESYGKDLGKMIDKALQGDKLSDPTKVAEAVLYKGKERFYAAEKLLKQAKEAGANKLDLQATAIGEMVEGCRQQVKVFDLLDARDIARIGVNGQSKIPSSLRDSIGVLRKLSVDGSIDITQAQNALSVMGTNIDDVMYEMYRTVIAIG